MFFEYLQKAKSDDLTIDLSSKIDRLDALYGKILGLAESNNTDANNINTADVVEQLKDEFFKRDLEHAFSSSEIVRHLTGIHGHELSDLRKAFDEAKNVTEFKNTIEKPDGTKPSCWTFKQAVDPHLDIIMKERDKRASEATAESQD